MEAQEQDIVIELTRERFEALRNHLHRAIPAAARRFAPVYEALDWTWGYSPRRVPDADDIEKCLYELLEHLDYERHPHGGQISTGGLTVWLKRTDGTAYECGIKFTDTTGATSLHLLDD